MKEEKKNARLAALEEMSAEVSKSTKGRKTLIESGKEERVPFTTSISRLNRERLGIYSAKKGQRIADILDEVLNSFFADK
ncbi:MAG: hypothetical protein JNL70_01125 [Saprospiraceae bacterium]|nr:hypothetical protein [Saprospiraceae bacterium]